MSKPTFDPLSLRSIRNDALIQYSSTNQSEPLRINLYFLLACTCFAFPTISESLGIQTDLNVPSILPILASVGGGIGAFALFLRECQARSKQLYRIEREMNAEFLVVKLADSLGGNIQSLKELGQNQQKKILAIAGSRDEVKKILMQGMVLRRRLVQANCLIVVVPVDISNSNDMKWNWEKEDSGIIGGRWLAQSNNLPTWIDYFTDLANIEDNNNDSDESVEDSKMNDGLLWFGLNANRRSFGSGTGSSSLKFLELMGSFLRPTVIINEDDPPDSNSNPELIEAQQTFYKALCTGDKESMKKIWSPSSLTAEVTEVIEAGGRIDDWGSCLMDGARPEDMLTSDSDAWVKSDTEAYTTTIEFPPTAPMESGSLLAIQRWTRMNKDDEWKLDLHQTIPWTAEAKANGTLRCDSRGCVALTRSREKRTFGTMIG